MGQVEDFRLFMLVVDNHGISKAAEKLNIAKSAVSRRLSLLEERYGTRLIAREPGRWEVTATGRELYQRAVGVVGEVDEIENDFTDSVHDLAGPLSISVSSDYGSSGFNEQLRAFIQRHPEIQLTVDFNDRIIDLSRESYDFALRITLELSSGLVGEKLGTMRHGLYASPAYLSKHGTPQSLDDLNDHALLHYGSARKARWSFTGKKGKAMFVEFQPAINSNNGLFLVDASLKGLGIVRAPNFLTRSALKAGDLVPILPEIEMPEWGIYLVYSENHRLNRRMRLFIDEMKSDGVLDMPISAQIK